MKRLKISDFYESDKVIHEFVEAKRSQICYNLIIDLITNKINHRKKMKFLDIGCGDGKFAVNFKKYCEVYGVDISQIAVEKALKIGVSACKVDVSCEELPFPSKYFDIVYIGDVIEHLVNPDFSVREMARVMKSDGFAILSTPNLASWLNRLLLLLGMQPLFSEVSTIKQFGRFKEKSSDYPVGHLRLFTLRALKQFLHYHKFKIVKIIGAPCGSLSKGLDYVDEVFSKIPPLSSIIIVLLCKTNKQPC